MSDYGLFESDEASQAEPRLAAKTAGRKMEAAIEGVRRSFGRFLIAATGIDEFEDRWHLSKNDIRASVEPLVFPNTGTMRRIKNALKADWKLAHPYKLAVEDAGFGSMPSGDRARNQDLDETYQPSSGNLIPSPDFEGYKNSVDQGGPAKVDANDFTDGGDSGSDRHARRTAGGLSDLHRDYGFSVCNVCGNEVDPDNQGHYENPDDPSDRCRAAGKFGSLRVARDPHNYDTVGHEYTHINDPEGSLLHMEDDGDHEGVHNYYRNLMEEPPAGYPRRDRSVFEDEKPVVKPPYTGPGELGSFVEDSDEYAPVLAHRVQAGGAHPDGGFDDDSDSSDPDGDAWLKKQWDKDDKDSKKEAAKLVADIYSDFAQSNGLRVASMDSLNIYASTGIVEADYRVLANLIRIAEEEEAEKASDGDDEDDSDDEDEDYDFGGEGGSEGDEEGSEGDDEDSDSDDDSDDDEEYDFGGGDDSKGGEGGGQSYTVPDQAPDLDPQVLNEIPHDDTDGTAPVPPNVIDSLLGLPEGTIEQLLLQEVEQGQGGAPQAPQGGGDDFLGQGSDDAEQEPPRVARRRRAIKDTRGRDQSREWAIDQLDDPSTKNLSDEELQKRLHEDMGRDPEYWNDKESSRRVAKDYGRKCPECKSNNTDYSSSTNDYDCYDCGATFKPYSNPKKSPEKESSRQARQFWAAPDESEDELTERQKREQKDSLDTKHESWMKSKAAARRFWAADGDQEPQEDPSGGGQPPQGDPSQGGGDPAAMGGDPSAMGGMMPPPGSQSVAPPAPPAPLENQPAEDALLDTANQAIMQMIDRETQEYQQIIGPLSQALQAVQFAQQVEQSEHPMDVTPPDGSVNVDPSQAPGGAQNPQQQLARLMRQARIDQRQAKKVRVLKNAAHLIARTYGVSERMLLAAMGRRHYEHLAEAFHILPPEAHQTPEVRAAANHIGKMCAAENPMFNFEAWIDSTVGGGMARAASNPRDRAGDAWRDGRDRGVAEHGRQDQLDWFSGPDDGTDTPYRGKGANNGGPDPVGINASRSRHPFDRPRLAGETWKNTPTMDRFEFPNEQPETTDNMTINDLPKQAPKGLPKMKARRRHAVDLGTKVQKWLQRQTDSGLNSGGDTMAERYLTEHKNPSSQKGIDEVHQAVGATPHAPEPAATAPKVSVPKAVNPTTKKGSWGEWEPPKTASFFTRRVPGWKWDDHLSGYLSKEARNFTCSCGEKVASPSYKTCRCGKIWNVYAIGDTHHLASDTADVFIAREIPVRDNVIMANRKMAKGDSDCTCWEGYERVPGTEPCASKSCRKKTSARAKQSHAELIAMIDKLADWTKYDGPDPARAFGKDKPASTDVSPPPSDWATRLPKGDPSKKGGTWTRPTIPRKKK